MKITLPTKKSQSLTLQWKEDKNQTHSALSHGSFSFQIVKLDEEVESYMLQIIFYSKNSRYIISDKGFHGLEGAKHYAQIMHNELIKC